MNTVVFPSSFLQPKEKEKDRVILMSCWPVTVLTELAPRVRDGRKEGKQEREGTSFRADSHRASDNGRT